MIMRLRPRRSGFTLAEMVAVVAIVVVLTALSIPALLRLGVFSSDRTGDSARQLYEAIRAARVYATTKNVETAIVYHTRMDFDAADDDAGGPDNATDVVPVIDGYMICRRATDAEIQFVNDNFLVEDTVVPGTKVGLNELAFIPVEGGTGRFTPLPSRTCVLSDIFEVDPAEPALSVRGLSPVFVIDPEIPVGENDATGFMDPPPHILDPTIRLHFQQEDGDASTVLDGATAHSFELQNPGGTFADINAFPAHRFSTTGEMLPIADKQRFTMRVGMLPSTVIQDRFVTTDENMVYDPDPYNPAMPHVQPADCDMELVTIQFHGTQLPLPEASPQDTELGFIYHDPRRLTDPDYVDPGYDLGWFMEITTNLSVYTSTGRVKIEPGRTWEPAENN